MKTSSIVYGGAPTDLGHVPLDPTEMLCYLYLPIRMVKSAEGDRNGGIRLPERLEFLEQLIDLALADADRTIDPASHYVYLTAKTLWVEGGFSGNRPGWHADGYGSGGDLNFVWANMNPTEFAVQPFRDVPDDDFASMRAMEAQIDPARIRTYPDCHLLRLDESIVHRVNPDIRSGMRTFVKISVSRHRFNLKMNSHNHLFDYRWTMHDRSDVRNVDNKDHVLDQAA